jgi:hypothetical protein
MKSSQPTPLHPGHLSLQLSQGDSETPRSRGFESRIRAPAVQVGFEPSQPSPNSNREGAPFNEGSKSKAPLDELRATDQGIYPEGLADLLERLLGPDDRAARSD